MVIDYSQALADAFAYGKNGNAGPERIFDCTVSADPVLIREEVAKNVPDTETNGAEGALEKTADEEKKLTGYELNEKFAETPVVDAPESVEAAPAPEQAAADQTAQEKTAAEQAAAEKAAAEKAAAEKAAAEKAAAEKAAAEKAAAEKARAQSQAAATGERRVTLSTSGACWVQILLPNGRSFFAKEMAEGGSETLNVPVGARVTVGNASVMTLTVDGRPYELTKSTRNGICRFVVK